MRPLDQARHRVARQTALDFELRVQLVRQGEIIGLSVDPVSNHTRWSADIAETQGHEPNYPTIGEQKLSVLMSLMFLPTAFFKLTDFFLTVQFFTNVGFRSG